MDEGAAERVGRHASYWQGALCTLDRDYGVLNKVFHNITDTHVAHHLFSTMPHYHAMEATKAIKPLLGSRTQSASCNRFRDVLLADVLTRLQDSTMWWTRRRQASRASHRRCGRRSSTASACISRANCRLTPCRFVEDFGSVLWCKFK